jgi:hypothetical protein
MNDDKMLEDLMELFCDPPPPEHPPKQTDEEFYEELNQLYKSGYFDD